MARVVLAMSGGVDSSVAAHLLLEQGHDVIGVFMRHGQQSPVACATDPSNQAASRAVSAPASFRGASNARNETPRLALPVVNRLDHKQGCCTAADAEDARRVADRLNIPFYALNLDLEFGRIIDYFVAEYAAGRTPNPCVQCNNWIKFGKLFDYADSVGAGFVATGHYARLEQRSRRGDRASPALLRGRDTAKDQSYVLFGIERRNLDRMLLPVGDYQKPEIRRMAASLGLNVASKKDSQEICFVTSGRYNEFVKQRLDGDEPASTGDRSGEFVLTTGEVVGRHEGIEGFTVGQRKGLGIALGEPKFVVRIEADVKRVVLGDREELGKSELTAIDCNWLVEPNELPARGEVQIRYNAPPAPASIELTADGRLQVLFDEPQFGVAPGQAAVCYDGNRVLGGGWIE
jgi:tRNA-specific 2-thiouridylase